MGDAASYLELYDYRVRVLALYRGRKAALRRGHDPALVLGHFRDIRDALFGTHSQSALDLEQKAAFQGLEYFPYNPEASIEATLDLDVEPQRLEVATSGEEVMPMQRVAMARFDLEGRTCALSVYWIDVYGGGLFLPFRDATAPAETYGGGRYLFDTVKGSDYLSLPSQGGAARIVLDFNYAYNPSCAYNPRWVCPLAPPENRLDLPIRAGEKRFIESGDHS